LRAQAADRQDVGKPTSAKQVRARAVRVLLRVFLVLGDETKQNSAFIHEISDQVAIGKTF
jgi:hypothetical protein